MSDGHGTTLPYQPAVYLVVRVPYGETPMDDRDDVDDELLAAAKAITDQYEGSDASVLDEHGIADWMHATIKRGLVIKAGERAAAVERT